VFLNVYKPLYKSARTFMNEFVQNRFGNLTYLDLNLNVFDFIGIIRALVIRGTIFELTYKSSLFVKHEYHL
jgi:hypothetical protein